MRSDVLIVARPGRRPRIECRGGIAGRDTGDDTVHLISSAATPLGGDLIAVHIVVEPGARLRLRSAAATVALPGAADRQSHACWTVETAGVCDIDLEPTVVAADARHNSEVRVTIHDDASLRLRERVQIGRAGEAQGKWSGLLYADLDATPLLRHRVEMGAGCVADDVIAAPRACISELRYPATAFTDCAQKSGTPLALAAGGVLTTWQGDRLI